MPPEVLLDPVLARTGVTLIDPHMLQYANILTWWHPLRIAEQAAMLDVVSGGRVEFGLGRGYQPREVEVFGRTYGSTIQDQERNRSSFEEALELLLKAWTEPSFSHHGENFSIPPLYTKWHHNMTIELLSQPGYERSVEQVLKLAKPDIYASGNAVIDTPTGPDQGNEHSWG